MRFGQNQHQKSKDASSKFWKQIYKKGGQPAIFLKNKIISQRKSSKSLSKLSNNSADLLEGSSIDRRGGVFIALLKETGCGAKSNQPGSVKGPANKTHKKIY
jgi:hypothetical protein